MIVILSALFACSACARKEEGPAPAPRAVAEPLAVRGLADSPFGAAMKEIGGHRGRISMLLLKGARTEVRPEAEAIARLAAGLPEKTAALDPADQASVAKEAVTLAERAGKLADLADGGDAAATGAAFRELNQTLDLLTEMAR
jgi:hypothetical protein